MAVLGNPGPVELKHASAIEREAKKALTHFGNPSASDHALYLAVRGEGRDLDFICASPGEQREYVRLQRNALMSFNTSRAFPLSVTGSPGRDTAKVAEAFKGLAQSGLIGHRISTDTCYSISGQHADAAHTFLAAIGSRTQVNLSSNFGYTAIHSPDPLALVVIRNTGDAGRPTSSHRHELQRVFGRG